MQDDLVVDGTLTINSGELDTGGNGDIFVAKGWMNHGGIFTPNTDAVFFNGAATNALILSGSQTFYNVDITGAGAWTLQDNVPVSSVFDVSAGTLTYATSTVIEPVSITGNTTITGGTFTGQSTNFRHDGNLTITSGTYTAPTGVLEIMESFSHTAGTFTNSSSTVMFSGTGTQTVTAGGTYSRMCSSMTGWLVIGDWMNPAAQQPMTIAATVMTVRSAAARHPQQTHPLQSVLKIREV